MSAYTKISLFLREKLNHPGVQKHTKNIGWMFAARIGSMIIAFIATAYIARHLGPHNYGELSYAISFVSLFSFIASLGIDAILHREIVRSPKRRNEFIGSAVALRAIGAVIAVIVTVVAALYISPKDVSLLLIFIISLSALCGSFQLLSYEFQADTNTKYSSILTLSIVAILNILKIVVILFNKGVIYLALVTLLEPVLYSIGYIYIKQKVYKDIAKIQVRRETMLLILKDSFPLIFASAFFVIYTRIDQVMLKNMINSEAVGLYDAAVRISEVSYFIPQTFLLSFFPAVMNAKTSSPGLYYIRTRNLLLLLLSISLVIAFSTLLLSKELILIIFGASFIGALPALYICVWATIGASLNSFAQQILIIEDMTKHITLTTFLGMITNVILNIILIPQYGISGAALATLISYMVPFLSLLLFKKTRTLLLHVFTV